MSSEHSLASKHFNALLEDARAEGIPVDVVGRALLNQLLESWLEERAWKDVAEELRFTAECLEPDRDFEFMRP